MRLVPLLAVVFMAAALGGWFGFRFAADQWTPTLPAADGPAPSAGEAEGTVFERISAIARRLDELESGMERMQEPSSAEEAPEADRMDADGETEAFEERAASETIVLTDLQNRKLEVEILGFGEGTVVIRRLADRRQFELPVERLVPADQRFLRYLSSAENSPSFDPPEVPDEQIDWESIFGKME